MPLGKPLLLDRSLYPQESIHARPARCLGEHLFGRTWGREEIRRSQATAGPIGPSLTYAAAARPSLPPLPSVAVRTAPAGSAGPSFLTRDIAMSNVIAFTPRLRPPEPAAPVTLAGIDLRTHLEEAAQTALDAADKIIAALDRMEEAPAGIEAAKAASDPDGREEFRDTYARGRARDRAIAVPKPASPEPEPQVEIETEPEPVILPEIRMPPAPLPWHGAGNVVAATGCAFLAMIGAA